MPGLGLAGADHAGGDELEVNIVIMGCGRLGSALAADLANAGHTVTIMDINPEAFRRLPANFHGTAVIGNGIDEDALRRARIEAAEVFIASTQGDNRNLMAAQIARHIFKVPRVISRVYDRNRAQLYQELDVETVSPTDIMAGMIKDLVGHTPGSVKKES